MRKLEKGEIVVCRSLNQAIVLDDSGRKLLITDPLGLKQSDEELKQQFKCLNVKKEVKGDE